jgi:hypothetical protein
MDLRRRNDSHPDQRFFSICEMFSDDRTELIIIRDDRDVEILIFTNYCLALSRKDDYNVKLDNIYYYEINIKNQRVKSFWGELTMTQIG